MKINWVEIENVKSFKDKTRVLLNPEHNFVVGTNGSGKTTTLQVLASCMLVLIPTYTPQNEGHGDSVTKYAMVPSLPPVTLPKNYNRKTDPQLITLEISFENSWDDLMSEVKSYLDIFKKHGEYIDVNFWDSSNHTDKLKQLYDDLKDKTDRILQIEFEIIQPSEGTQTLKLTDDMFTKFESILKLLETIEVQRIIYNQLFRAGKTTKIVDKGLQVIYLSSERQLGFPRSITLNRNSPQEYNQNNAYTRKNNMMASVFNESSFDYITQTLTRLGEAIIYQRWVKSNKNPLKSIPEYTQLKKYVKDLLGFDFKIEIPGSPYEDIGVNFMADGNEILFNQLSSGERSLMYFIFTLANADIKNSFILIDEAEIHLHGNMQDTLLEIIFNKSELNNQHFISTHSPKLINTVTISHVLRFFKKDNVTNHINFRTDASLGDDYEIVRLINGQNNEKVFFADKVILVEGISDRILLEKLIKRLDLTEDIIEVIDVGGKSNIPMYRKYLNQVKVPNYVLADFDYLYDISKSELASIYEVNKKKMAQKIVKKNSIDGQTLINMIEEHIKNNKKKELGVLIEYIKSSNATLKKTLTPKEKSLLRRVRDKHALAGMHILSRGITIDRKKYTGEIEDYLLHLGSRSNKSKLIHELVNYVDTDTFLADFIAKNNKWLVKELMMFLADVLYADPSRFEELVNKAKSSV